MGIKVTSRKAIVHTVTGVEDLDPVHFCMEDFGVGQGSITIDCFGEAWAMYWPAVGEFHKMKEFFLKASTCYLVNKLTKEPQKVTDFEAVAEAIGEDEVFPETLWLHEKALVNTFGEDWYHNGLPEIPNHKYEYVCKIVEAVKLGIKEITND